MSTPSIDSYNAALDALQGGKLATALQAIENALVEDPTDPESWQLYALILHAAGRKSDAESAAEKLKSLGASPAVACMLEGDAAMAGGDVEHAILKYGHAAELDPEQSDCRIKLAVALLESGQSDAALGVAIQAVKLAPGDAHANYLHGRILRLTGRPTEALAALTRAVELDSELMPAVYEQGMLLADADDLGAALENFERYLAKHPDDPSATQAMGQLRSRMSRTL